MSRAMGAARMAASRNQGKVNLSRVNPSPANRSKVKARKARAVSPVRRNKVKDSKGKGNKARVKLRTDPSQVLASSRPVNRAAHPTAELETGAAPGKCTRTGWSKAIANRCKI